MNKTFALASIILMLGLTTAQAQTIDFRTYKCSKFIALPENIQELVAVWLDGFLSDDEDPQSMQVDFAGTDTDEIRTYCQSNPGALLPSAAEEAGAEE